MGSRAGLEAVEKKKISCPYPEIETRYRNAPILVVFPDVRPVGWFVFTNISRKRAIFIFNEEFLS
jgi:hypothetical protein